MSKKFKFGPVNNKLNIIILIVGVVLLSSVLLIKTLKPKQQSAQKKTASQQSSVVSEIPKEEESVSSEFEIIDSTNVSEAQIRKEAEERAERTMIQMAANQILTLGGSWSVKEDSTKTLTFTVDGKYNSSGFEKEMKGKFRIESAEFTEGLENSSYAYQVTLESGDVLLISVYDQDTYTLSSDTFFESDSLIFTKTAKIAVGNQKNPNGMTDEEKNRLS